MQSDMFITVRAALLAASPEKQLRHHASSLRSG